MGALRSGSRGTMHRVLLVAPLAVAALTLAVPVAAADGELPTQPMSAEDAAAIDAYVAEVMA